MGSWGSSATATRGRSRHGHSEFGSHSIAADCARLLNSTWTNSERRSKRALLILVFVSRPPEGPWNARQAIRATTEDCLARRDYLREWIEGELCYPRHLRSGSPGFDVHTYFRNESCHLANSRPP